MCVDVYKLTIWPSVCGHLSSSHLNGLAIPKPWTLISSWPPSRPKTMDINIIKLASFKAVPALNISFWTPDHHTYMSFWHPISKPLGHQYAGPPFWGYDIFHSSRKVFYTNLESVCGKLCPFSQSGIWGVQVGCRVEFRPGHLSFFIPNQSNQVFMELALCTGPQSC